MYEENKSLPADFSEIFDRYGSVIFSYLLVHASSREEAEDLTIDVFTAALEHTSFLLWDAPRSIAWLKRVAYSRLVDSFRRSKRRSFCPNIQVASLFTAKSSL